ncbi:MAG: phosphoribosylanthranilate isomerase [Candidatus Aminicenantes bacterium]|nr:phosphoribosylanthranilate isomerase [Candidatus Aminicenantes bacterium]
MIRVKICGVTNKDDALRAAEWGADALGFVFVPGPRKVSTRTVRKIIEKLPPFVQTVGVFVNPEAGTVKKIAAECGLDRVQFHGRVTRSCFDQFREKAIKVFEISEKKALEDIRRSALPFFMLDLPKGGTHTAPIEAELVREAGRWGKVILAGGLTPENINDVLRQCTPHAVDVCRGVEREGGKKCPLRLKKFIYKVKLWSKIRFEENMDATEDGTFPRP